MSFVGTPTTAIRNNDSSPGSTITVAKPTGIVSGEALVFFVAIRRASSAPITTWPAPTGCLPLGIDNDAQSNGPHVHSWYLPAADVAAYLAGSGVPADFTFEAQSVTGDMVAWASRYEGGDPATFIDAAGGTPTAGTGTAISTPSVTTVTAGADVVAASAKSHGEAMTSWTAPLVQIGEVRSTNATVQNRITLTIAHAVQAVAGASGAGAATQSGARAWGADAGAIRPLVFTVVAGPGQNVDPGDTVTLTASGATTYTWTPDPANDMDVILDADNVATVHFVAPTPPGAVAVPLVFEVEGTDGVDTDTDTVTVTVAPFPEPCEDPGVVLGIPMKVRRDGEWVAIGEPS